MGAVKVMEEEILQRCPVIEGAAIRDSAVLQVEPWKRIGPFRNDVWRADEAVDVVVNEGVDDDSPAGMEWLQNPLLADLRPHLLRSIPEHSIVKRLPARCVRAKPGGHRFRILDTQPESLGTAEESGNPCFGILAVTRGVAASLFIRHAGDIVENPVFPPGLALDNAVWQESAPKHAGAADGPLLRGDYRNPGWGRKETGL